jgi:predicted ATPase
VIRELRIENLKAFRGNHKVRLAPLTLVYGSNSAGKSTLIQALLLLKQTFESSDPDQPELVVRGNLADLGSLPGILHGHELDRTLAVGITIDQPVVRPNSPLGSRRRRYDFSFRWDEATHTVRQTGASLGLGETDLLGYTRRRGPDIVKTPAGLGERQFPFRIGRARAREVFVEWIASLMTDRRIPSLSMRRYSADDMAITTSSLLDVGSFAAAPWGIIPVYPRLSFTRAGKSRGRLLDRTIVRDFEYAWNRANVQFRNDLATTLESLVYLGPLRVPPARFHLISGIRRTSVGHQGEYLAELLSRRTELVTEVNGWLSRLQIPYELSASRMHEQQLGTTMGDVVSLLLTDRRNGLIVSPGDVGFGISQLLPIVVQALIGQRSVLCVEQPEIHVHPRLQAEMANLLVAATRRRNQLIVETHSEHIMLRIQHLIRTREIAADRVAVLYVDTAEDGTASVVNLRLDKEGDFIDDWPQGFFEERFEEMFRGR